MVDSVQSMLKDMHTGHGALVVKTDALEAAVVACGGQVVLPGARGDSAKLLQQEVGALEARLKGVEEAGREVGEALKQVRGVGGRA